MTRNAGCTRLCTVEADGAYAANENSLKSTSSKSLICLANGGAFGSLCSHLGERAVQSSSWNVKQDQRMQRCAGRRFTTGGQNLMVTRNAHSGHGSATTCVDDERPWVPTPCVADTRNATFAPMCNSGTASAAHFRHAVLHKTFMEYGHGVHEHESTDLRASIVQQCAPQLV